jgi:putative sigma-54 modulation protein
MKLILNTHNISLTEAIEDHVRGRIEKLEHIETHAMSVRVNLEFDKNSLPEKQFRCSMKLSFSGPDVFAEDTENDMYAAIDLVTQKVQAQIRKRHSKFKARNHSEAIEVKEASEEASA